MNAPTPSTSISMKELLESGVHFGHQSTNWNPKMSEYIFIKRKGLHIINLQKTMLATEKAYTYARNAAANGETILFVGTKKQARQSIATHAKRCNQPYIANRWIGGLLTNFQTVKKSIEQMDMLSEIVENPDRHQYTKKELLQFAKKRNKLEETFGGIRGMKEPPGMLFIVDSQFERNAVVEARKQGIPILAVVDTNADPSLVDVVIPGNDDAIRAVNLFASHIADAILSGSTIHRGDLVAEVKDNADEVDGVEGGEVEVEEEGFEAADDAEESTPKQPQAPKDSEGKTMDYEASAADVKSLREMTGSGLMECKKALVEAKGDAKKAVQLLKEKGLAMAEKRSGKEAKEGLIQVELDSDGRKAALVRLGCETDFVVKNEAFRKTATSLTKTFLKEGLAYKESDALKATLTELTAKTGERIIVDALVAEDEKTFFYPYLHSNEKVGAVVGLKVSAELKDEPAVQQFAKDLAMQVVAMNPIALTESDVSDELKKEQEAVFRKQLEDDKKPEEVQKKILAGKLKKYFAEHCLMEMAFIKEPKDTVKQHQDKVLKGLAVEVSQYHRLGVG